MSERNYANLSSEGLEEYNLIIGDNSKEKIKISSGYENRKMGIYTYHDIDGIVPDMEIDRNNRLNCILPDSNEKYTVETKGGKDFDLYMSYANHRLQVKAETGNQVHFEPDGKVELLGNSGNYELSIVGNDGFRSTPWDETIVSGQNAKNISLEQVDEGIVVSGDNLDDIRITACSVIEGEFHEEISVSTSEESILLTANQSGEPVVMLDKDSDGKYEFELTDFIKLYEETTEEVLPENTYNIQSVLPWFLLAIAVITVFTVVVLKMKKK